MNAKGLYATHGLIMAVALLILLPIGIYYAIAKPQGWYSKHKAIQMTVLALVAVAVGISLYTRAYVDQQKSKEGLWHGMIGITLLVLLILQIAWGIIGNPNVTRQTYLTVHRSLAVLIVGLVLIQVYLGYKVWSRLAEQNNKEKRA